MSYDLKRLALESGSKRGKAVIRNLRLTDVQRTELLKITIGPSLIWRRYIENDLLTKVRETTTDSPDEVRRDLEQTQNSVDRAIEVARSALDGWSASVVSWHTSIWSEKIGDRFGIDPKPFLEELVSDEIVRAQITSASGLIKNVSDEVRKGIEQSVFQHYKEGWTRRELIAALESRLDRQASRAAGIANDQSNKIASSLNKARNTEAGIEQYEWIHSGKRNPRPEHVARDGKIFSWDDPPSDGHPGDAINCGCNSKAVLFLDGERI